MDLLSLQPKRTEKTKILNSVDKLKQSLVINTKNPVCNALLHSLIICIAAILSSSASFSTHCTDIQIRPFYMQDVKHQVAIAFGIKRCVKVIIVIV